MFEDFPSDEEIDGFIEENETYYFESNYNFLKAIKGLRPSMAHGLLAPAGAGKSTLTRTIISETSQKHKIGVLLSEEKHIQYSSALKIQKENYNKANIKLMRESVVCNNFKTKEEQIDYIVQTCILSDVKVLFWDNITTGKILGDSVLPSKVAELFERLKDKLGENKIALFYVAHTRKDIKAEHREQFTGEDMRGSNQIFMQSEYFFTLQTKTVQCKDPKDGQVKDKPLTFVSIYKSRFHNPEYKFYILTYKNRKYVSDQGVAYSIIKEIFSSKTKG